MAVTLLRVLVVGVIAAAADDVPITWLSTSQRALKCEVPDAEKVFPRRPPPPLDAEDKTKSRPIIWRRDNKEIKRLPWNGTLEVLKNGSREGVYQCAVKHHGGFILGYPINLKFAYIDEEFTVNPSNVTAHNGQPFILTCDINSGPPAVITWLKNNVTLPRTSRYHILKNQLLISEINKEDTGVYRCKATNTFLNETRYSQTGQLLVEDYTGDISVQLLPVNVDHSLFVPRGSRVVLPCTATGWVKPRLIWELTPPGGRTAELEAVDQILVLSNIQDDQEGVYNCTVEGISDLVKTFNVTITEPLSIELPPISKQTVRANTVRFNCTAAGRPTPTVTWYKDGKPLVLAGRIAVLPSADGSRRELLIRSVTSNDAGVYQCMVRSGDELVSAWGVLEVRGTEAAGPSAAWCEPLSPTAVHVHWPRIYADVVAYTIQKTDPDGSSLPVQPVNNETFSTVINVNIPLAPYHFQVQAFIHLAEPNRTVASEFSKTITCAGQGVPVKLGKISDDTILVSWKQFHKQNPGVVEWILQYRVENSTVKKGITLNGTINSYTLTVPKDKVVHVRVLGSRTHYWLQQNLTLVPWTSTSATSQQIPSVVTAIPEDLQVSDIGPRQFSLKWKLNKAESYSKKYSYKICITKLEEEDEDHCIKSPTMSAIVKNLDPNTEYDVRVQGVLPGDRNVGEFSPSIHVNTEPEVSEPKSVQFEWTRAGLRVSWEDSENVGEGESAGEQSVRVVRYSQKLTNHMELWPAINVTGNTVTISDLDPDNTTYVMVSAPGPIQQNPVHNVKPRPAFTSVLYVAIGAACGVLVLCLMVVAAVCIWRRRKRSRTPVRSRRRRRASNAEDGEERSEMKNIGFRLANGSSSKDVGEPLLNGHVHIIENPSSKTPNGKIRKGHKHEAIFDVSRYEEPETMEFEAEANTSGLTAYTMLDTSRPPEYDTTREGLKFPDDNMNLGSNPVNFQETGEVQPTLQPNG